MDRLTFASWGGRVDVVKKLLQGGAEVNVPDKDGYTALHSASENGHVDVVKLLLQGGADVNVQDKNGWTALYWASVDGHVDVVKLLLEGGADVNVQDKDGDTALYTASREGHGDVVKLLLQAGADVNGQHKVGWTALHLASRKGHVDVVKLLLQGGADVNVQDEDGDTPLHDASWRRSDGQKEIIRTLIENGADLNVKNKDGRTPVEVANKRDRKDLAKLMTSESENREELRRKYQEEKVAELEAKLEKLTTSSTASSSKYQDERVAELEAKVEKLSASSTASSSKVTAIQGQDTSLARVDNTTREYPQPTSESMDGSTALHSACQDGNVDVVKLLLQGGVDVNIQDKDGRTAVYVASRNGHVDVVNLFLQRNADVNVQGGDGDTALHSASVNGHVEVVKQLLRGGADVNAQKWNRKTALHLASQYGRGDVAKVLLDGEADATLQDKDGNTALHVATQNGYVNVVKHLLQEEAGVNIQDKDGCTPLHFACLHQIAGQKEIIRTLIQNGADLNVRNKDGRIPVELAAKEGRQDLAELMTYQSEIREEKLKRKCLEEELEAFKLTASSKKNPAYKMSEKPRGIAIIINNEKFFTSTLKDRGGSLKDAKDIKTLLQDILHFDVWPLGVTSNLTAEKMDERLNEFRNEQLESYDSTVVVVLSHGKKDHVFGTDGKAVPVEKILEKFDNCQALRNKPKVFVFQACRGGTKMRQVRVTDGEGPDLTPSTSTASLSSDDDADPLALDHLAMKADTIMAYATFPGYVSWRNEDNGSYFIQAIVVVFTDNARDDDILTMLTKVNRKVAASVGQMPAHLHCLTKQLFFNP